MIRARTSFFLLFAELAAAILVSAMVGLRLPSIVPLHFDLAGNPNRYGSRFEALVLMPLLIAVLVPIAYFFSARMRDLDLRDRFAASIALTGGMFAGIHVMVLLLAGGAQFDVFRVCAFGMAAMMAALGTLFPGTPPNRWFGIRTPATLSSPVVWARTHVEVGRSYRKLGLVAMALCLLPIPGAVLLPLVFVALLVPPLMPRRAGRV